VNAVNEDCRQEAFTDQSVDLSTLPSLIGRDATLSAKCGRSQRVGGAVPNTANEGRGRGNGYVVASASQHSQQKISPSWQPAPSSVLTLVPPKFNNFLRLIGSYRCSIKSNR
jgi:hypothetical protein